MPIYEYHCLEHNRFESLRPMTEYSMKGYCPECGRESDRMMSNSHFRMAEPFRVMDSQGNITQERQAVNNTPEYNDSSVQPREVDTTNVKVPIISRGGSVYYPKGRK